MMHQNLTGEEPPQSIRTVLNSGYLTCPAHVASNEDMVRRAHVAEINAVRLRGACVRPFHHAEECPLPDLS